MSFFDKFIKKNITKSDHPLARLNDEFKRLQTAINTHSRSMSSSTMYVPTEDEIVSRMGSEEAEEYLKRVKEEREKEIEQLNERIESIETAISKKNLDEI